MDAGGQARSRGRKAGKAGLFRCNVVESYDFPGAGRRILHVRQFIRNQSPGIVACGVRGVGTVHFGVNALANRRCRRQPVRAACRGVVPTPVVTRCVDLLAGAGGHVLEESIRYPGDGVLSRLDLNHPAFRRAYRCVARGFAFQQESGSVGHLGDRRINSEVPHRCRNQVLARLEQRRQVEAFVSPMSQVAASRAVADAAPVHVQDESIIRTYPDHIAFRHSPQRQCPPEVQHQRLTQRRRGVRNPRSFPVVMRRVGRGRALGLQRESGESERD